MTTHFPLYFIFLNMTNLSPTELIPIWNLCVIKELVWHFSFFCFAVYIGQASEIEIWILKSFL